MAGNPNWKPGVSGNPAGRPKKERALTAVLEAAGSKTVEVDGKRITGKRYMALALWEGITTGKIPIGDRVMELSPTDWLTIVKFVYGQIDGPPPQVNQIQNADGETFRIEYVIPVADSTLPDSG